MSDSNRATLSYVKEVTFGTAPGTALTEIRFTGESLKMDTSTITSQEVRADRQITGIIRNGVSAAGDINIEVSFGSHEDFMRSALLSAAPTTGVLAPGTITGSITASATPTLTRASGSFITDGYTVGSWVYIQNFVNAANNTFWKITTVNALTMVLASGAAGSAVAETSVAGVAVFQGTELTAGTTLESYTIERCYTDLSTSFASLGGMCIDKFGVSVGADSIITAVFGFVGKTEVTGTATLGTGTITASSSGPVLNGIDNVLVILENKLAFPATSFSFELNNNLRARLQIGTLGAISVGVGSINIKGTLEAYFTSQSAFGRYTAFTTTDIVIIMYTVISAGVYRGVYIFDFPEVKLSAGERVIGGLNQDIYAKFTFEGFRDATENKTFRIARFI